METPAKLPLKEAIRVFWYNLLPLPLFVPFACYLLRLTNGSQWSDWFVLAIFPPITICADWPFIRNRVGWSYPHFAGFLYVVGGTILLVACELLLLLSRTLWHSAP